jgi:pimeloyl-ACP methyl ester carboxylesterase
MKAIILLASLFTPLLLPAQDIAGTWSGALNVQGTRLRMVFHIDQTDSGLVSTLDSPDQGAKGIPVDLTTFAAPRLRIELRRIGAVYEGTLSGDSITGTWKQSVAELPLVLKRGEASVSERRRPQEPVPPLPYKEESVRFANDAAGVTLAGTLTLPPTPGPHPAVILISGSGPQNRDEEVFGHRPFLVLADHLTRNGIAVLRYDDRGIVESTGDFNAATSMDFATDAVSAVGYLTSRKDIDPKKIGLVGHSEGALIAPIAAEQSGKVAFVVLLAGIGMSGKKVSIAQSKTLRTFPVEDEAAYERFTRRLYDIATSKAPIESKRAQLKKHYESIAPTLARMLPEGVSVQTFVAQQVAQLTSPWEQFFLTYDPATHLSRLRIPVLSLNGSKDVQVPAGPNQAGIRRALERAGNRRVVVKELPGLNHMFQEAETGAMSEYPRIDQTIAPVALDEITGWLLRQVR